MNDTDYRKFALSIGAPLVQGEFADDLLRSLGATEIDVVDASAYEGANIIHDLNGPLGEEFRNRYDSVLDGGALEHIFNFPIALKNCMEVVRVGGSLLALVPANNWCGHGFYQFSPELFHSVLTPSNGFVLERLLFVDRGRWYSVRYPAEVGTLVELRSNYHTLLFLSARKIEDKPIFQTWPQQSDYHASWEKPKADEPAAKAAHPFKNILIERSPFLQRLRDRWRAHKAMLRTSPKNRAHFISIDLDGDKLD
jgi:hypothetical protein